MLVENTTKRRLRQGEAVYGCFFRQAEPTLVILSISVQANIYDSHVERRLHGCRQSLRLVPGSGYLMSHVNEQAFEGPLPIGLVINNQYSGHIALPFSGRFC